MLNERMRKLARMIKKDIYRFYPYRYINVCFSDEISLNDVISQVLIECSEYAYMQNAEKFSLWKHKNEYEKRNGYDSVLYDDALRMRFQRAAAYSNRHIHELQTFVQEKYGMKIGGGFEKEENHYSINAVDFLNLLHLDDIDLCKVVIERKFTSKKFVNDDFRACSENYDDAVKKLMTANSDEEFVVNSLGMFSLEWQLYFDFLYEIVNEMEKNKVKKIPDMENRLIAFCYEPTIQSNLRYEPLWHYLSEITVVSRAVFLRRKYVHDIVNAKVGDEHYQLEQEKFLEVLFMVAMLKISLVYEDMPLCDWFSENTSMTDWASVFRTYNIFDVYVPNKNWTNKKIRYAREIYGALTFEYGKF